MANGDYKLKSEDLSIFASSKWILKHTWIIAELLIFYYKIMEITVAPDTDFAIKYLKQPSNNKRI